MKKKRKEISYKQENAGVFVCIALSVVVCIICVGSDIFENLSDYEPPEFITKTVSEFNSIKKSADKAANDVKGFINESDVENAISNLESESVQESERSMFEGFEKGSIVREIDDVTYLIDFNGTEKKVILAGVEFFYDDRASVKSDKWDDVSESIKDKTRAGTIVYVEYDDTINKMYGSDFAYIYTEDGLMIQEWLIANGYAAVSKHPPDLKYADSFSGMSEVAKKNKVGLWSEF